MWSETPLLTCHPNGMDSSDNYFLFANAADKFLINTEANADKSKSNCLYEGVLSSDTTEISESKNWTEIFASKHSVIPSGPLDLKDLGNVPKLEADETDFMHIAIDEMKLEWPPELIPDDNVKTAKVEETTKPRPPFCSRPASPLPELSDFLSGGLLENLPPVSPPPEKRAENFPPNLFPLFPRPTTLENSVDYQHNNRPMQFENDGLTLNSNPQWFYVLDNSSGNNGYLSVTYDNLPINNRQHQLFILNNTTPNGHKPAKHQSLVLDNTTMGNIRQEPRKKRNRSVNSRSKKRKQQSSILETTTLVNNTQQSLVDNRPKTKKCLKQRKSRNPRSSILDKATLVDKKQQPLVVNNIPAKSSPKEAKRSKTRPLILSRSTSGNIICKQMTEDHSSSVTSTSKKRFQNNSVNGLEDEGSSLENDFDSDMSWHESSDEESELFEREEQMEEILSKYHQGGINIDDNFIYCDLTGRRQKHSCIESAGFSRVKDVPVPLKTENRAKKTLPKQLAILPSKIKGANVGVWAREVIPIRSVFGPYEGGHVPVNYHNGEYCWKVLKHEEPDVLVDGQDTSISNWMRYVNCARTSEEQNLEAFQFRGEIFYRTLKQINENEELLVWCGFKYAQKLGIKWRDFVRSRLSDQKDSSGENPKPSQGFEPLSSATEKSPIYMEVTTGTKPITCGVCGARFRTRGQPLKTHMKTHKDETHNCCLKCGQWFPDEQSCEKHQTDVLKSRKSSKFSRKESPQTEIVLCSRKWIACPVCKSKFESKKAWYRHIQKRMENSTERKCLARENTEEQSEEEISGTEENFATEKTKSEVKKFLCEKCGRTFWRPVTLREHLEKRHKLRISEMSLSSSRDRDQEAFGKRCPAKRFRCKECGILYREKTTLEQHMKIHIETDDENEVDKSEEKKFSCQECGIRFRAETTLKYHMEVHEKEQSLKKRHEKRYKCKSCPMQYRAKSTLESHMKTHAEKTSECSFSTSKSKNISTKFSFSFREGFSERKRAGDVKDNLRNSCGKYTDKNSYSERNGAALNEDSSGSEEREENLEVNVKSTEKEVSSPELCWKKSRRVMSHDCLACGFIFKDRRALDEHVRKHVQEKQLFCDLSDVQIPSLSNSKE